MDDISEIQEIEMTKYSIVFYDNFFSSDQLAGAVTQTGYYDANPHNLALHTGIQNLSSCRINYLTQSYNPLYADLYIRIRYSSVNDVFSFVGFIDTLTAPYWQMVVSHSGLMIYNNSVYFHSGNGTSYQHVKLADIDPTRQLVIHIAGNSFRWWRVPAVVSQFDVNIIPGLESGLVNKWSTLTVNGSAIPEDKTHFVIAYIKNTVGIDKYVEIGAVSYSEQIID